MVFDIAALVFIVVFTYIMMKRGGVKAALSLSGLLLSIIVAALLYPVLTDIVYSTPLPENLEGMVKETLSLQGATEGWEAVDAMPDFVRNSVDIAANDSVEHIVDSVAQSIARVIINVMIFVLLIIVTKLAILVLTGALNLTMKLPVLRQLNSMVGFACGLVMSIVIVWIAVAFSGSLAASNALVASWIKGSHVVGILSNISPF